MMLRTKSAKHSMTTQERRMDKDQLKEKLRELLDAYWQERGAGEMDITIYTSAWHEEDVSEEDAPLMTGTVVYFN